MYQGTIDIITQTQARHIECDTINCKNVDDCLKVSYGGGLERARNRMVEPVKQQNKTELREAVRLFLNTPISSDLLEVFKLTQVFSDADERRVQQQEKMPLNFRDFFGKLKIC